MRSALRHTFSSCKRSATSGYSQKIVSVYGNIMNRQNVTKRCRHFSEGRTGVHDEQRTGRPFVISSALLQRTEEAIRRAIQNKRKGMLTNGVSLLHDNTRPHTAHVTKVLLKQFKREVLDHPPYSLDLEPSDFHLFRYLKSHLGGKSFHDDDEIKDEVEIWFRQQAATFYAVGYKSL
ncbi:histone-lysine N-methyltransferase SETMAR [Trichonephila clavipes]|nr:histone-lysine N-methyltransferase SETMAR [Trichonephila clavipes]